MYITYCCNCDSQYPLFHIVDCGTAYSEVKVLRNRAGPTLIASFDSDLFYRHVSPTLLSDDDEFNKSIFINSLKSRKITFLPRSTRIHNNLGTVELKNRTLEAVFERLIKADMDGTDTNITQKSIFFANIFSGNKHISALQLPRGYAPSISGIPSTRITQDFLAAYKQQASVIAL